MLPRPDQKTIDTIKHAANLLSGAARRAFQAQTVLDHCDGNLSHAKTLFGWHQVTLRRALLEREQGEPIPDKPGRGRKKTVERIPTLQADIRQLVDPNSCTHPTFENTFRYTRMTARAVLDALVREKGYEIEDLPALSTMRELLNTMGYRLRRVQKTKPQKKSRNGRDLRDLPSRRLPSASSPPPPVGRLLVRKHKRPTGAGYCNGAAAPTAWTAGPLASFHAAGNFEDSSRPRRWTTTWKRAAFWFRSVFWR